MITDYTGIVSLIKDIANICNQFAKNWMVFVSNGKTMNFDCSNDRKGLYDCVSQVLKDYKEGKCTDSEKLFAEAVLFGVANNYNIDELPPVLLERLNEYLP